MLGEALTILALTLSPRKNKREKTEEEKITF